MRQNHISQVTAIVQFYKTTLVKSEKDNIDAKVNTELLLLIFNWDES